MQSQIPSICISFLTQLLDLNSLEELLDSERESYVLNNIRSELGSDESFQDSIPDPDIHEKKDKKAHKKLLKSNSKESLNVFGGKLTEHSAKIIVQIIEHLKNYTDVEGLFRISGNKRRQEELKESLNKGQHIDLSDRTYSQHDLSTILKQYFSQLPEPLLTNSLYNCYKQVAGKTREMDGSTSSKKRLKALQLLSLLLPPLNRRLFKKLIELLHLVSEKTINLMTSKNLAVVFAPNIAAKTKISCLTDYNDNLEPLTEIMEFIIENATEIFKVPDEIFNLKKKASSSEDNDIVKTPTVYCQQSDPKKYHQETMKNTNEALAELYSQVVAMPINHPMRKHFLDDFKKKYPGTPPFIPQSRRLQRLAESPMANTTPLKRKSNVEQFSSINDEHLKREDPFFLSTPEKKRLFTDGDLAFHMTPESAVRDSRTNEPIFELTKEKRKKFRRPSFGRPSFGFLSKRSTPDLGKMRKTPSESNSKRTRSNSSTDLPDEDHKRRFSFTPFAERRNNPQRALTERRPSKKSNKVRSKDEQLSTESEKSSSEVARRESLVAEHFQCSNRKTDVIFQAKSTPFRVQKAKPELRAPLMNIKMTGKPLLPGLANPRRETLAINKEQVVNIDAYRPRRETLAIHREPSSAVPFKPRREHFGFDAAEPVLESFRPKRDSLLIHKKMQPNQGAMRCVSKQVYSDCENAEPTEGSRVQSQKNRNVIIGKKIEQQSLRDVDWALEFKTFGKSSADFEEGNKDIRKSNANHARRMSTGSIAKGDWTKLRPLDDGCLVTFL